MKKIKLLSIVVSTGTYKDFVQSLTQLASTKKSCYACLANVHMLVEAYKDANFSAIVNNAQMVTPDGKPLTWALRLLHGIKQERVAGMDLLPDLLSAASEKDIAVYIYGGDNILLQNTEKYLQKMYPQLVIAGLYSPPYRALSQFEEVEVVKRINETGAGFVFVVLGCPKQERWMHAMMGRINAVMVGVGGALPVLVGMQKRAPCWMQHVGLEWLFRLKQEPERLFKRYAVTNCAFVSILLIELMRFKFLKRLDNVMVSLIFTADYIIV